MTQRRQILITAFALFSLFFGAGNLILPPFLGYNAGQDWIWVALGFAISAVIIPIIAIYGHARLQGTMLDFANKVSPAFAVVYSICVYAISISLPSPRTASVAYEMAFQPYFEISSLMVSVVYFVLVLSFVFNRSRILSIIGKYLTPLIIMLLLAVILLGLFADAETMRASVFGNTFTEGILEGYQTFDAIGGVVVGAVLVISFAIQGKYGYQDQRKMIARSGLIAGIGLFLIYGGLIVLGAHYSGTLEVANRVELLNVLSVKTLGNTGTAFLAVLVALACFTTAVGIVAGTADFVKGMFKDSQTAYIVTAVLGCVIGVLVGHQTVLFIIKVAIPALMFIYPITIVLIILSVLPEMFRTALVYRATVLITIVFSIPDFLHALQIKFYVHEDLKPVNDWLTPIRDSIPLGKEHMGWVLPALITLLLTMLIVKLRKTSSEQ